jgi:hypothetical protein
MTTKNQHDILGLIVKAETQLIDLSLTLKQVLQLMAQLDIRVAELERRITDAGLHIGPVAEAWRPEPGEKLEYCEHGFIDSCPEGCN